ncbi:MAG: L,D-transpeptidase family protein [Clostridiaceae bacterium]
MKKIPFIILLILLFSNAATIEARETMKNLGILIDLTEERLYLIDKDENRIIKSYPVASGKHDTPSPIGTWNVVSKGAWSGGFGTRWIGLNVPWGKFGIHGTNKPNTIGSKASHGCIRMRNNDVEDLYKYVKHGMIVAIYEGPYGPFGSGLRTLTPGDRGSAVYEIQRRLKDKGYYPGNMDGIYGEGMKKYVLKFRRDNNLSESHNIDKDFYKKLGIILMD